jgi:uncharacterized protein YbaR (Trm112 family)
VLVIEAAASAIHLENLGAKIMGRDVAGAEWRALLSVDDSDVCELGDEDLGGGTRIVSDGIDELVTKYPGDTAKKIWHEGHFASAPIFTTLWESTGVDYDTSGSGSKYTVAHNLGFFPKLWMGLLKCTNGANSVYTIGDEVPIMSTFVAGDASDMVCTVDATNFYYRTTDAIPNMVNDQGGAGNIKDNSWDVIFRVWY